MKLLLSTILLFIVISLNGQSNEYMQTTRDSIQVRNLTAIVLKQKELKHKIDSITANKGKSQYQEGIVEMTHYLALSMFKLNEYTEDGKRSLAAQYGNLSWYYLFDSKFAKATEAAVKALELDSSQIWVNTNLGHSYLLQGDLKKAKGVYSTILTKKHVDGTPFSDVLLKDFEALKKEGIDSPLFNRASSYIIKKGQKVSH